MEPRVKWFDRYGEPLFTDNTPKKNRDSLVMQRTKPSSKAKGGARGKPKRNPLHVYERREI